MRFDDVRDQGLVELLHPALVDEEPGEPRVVGEDEDVAVDALSLRERALDLGEVGRVVVDVLVVVDGDAFLFLELFERRRLLRVDVVRPVREVEDVEHLAARLVSTTATAAGGEQARQRQNGDPGGPPPQELISGQPRVHSVSSSFVDSDPETTNVASGLQLRVTFAPGAAACAPELMFCANTWMTPAGVRTTTCVATPMYADSTTVPVELVLPTSAAERDLLRTDAGRHLARAPVHLGADELAARQTDGVRPLDRPGQQIRDAEEAWRRRPSPAARRAPAACRAARSGPGS